EAGSVYGRPPGGQTVDPARAALVSSAANFAVVVRGWPPEQQPPAPPGPTQGVLGAPSDSSPLRSAWSSLRAVARRCRQCWLRSVRLPQEGCERRDASGGRRRSRGRRGVRTLRILGRGRLPRAVQDPEIGRASCRERV